MTPRRARYNLEKKLRIAWDSGNEREVKTLEDLLDCMDDVDAILLKRKEEAATSVEF